MGAGLMRVEWHAPVTVHIHPDVTDPRSSQLRRSSDGAVQLLVGSGVVVQVSLQDAAGAVSAHAGDIVAGVVSLELYEAAEFDEAASIDDDTIARVDGTVAAGGAALPSLTRAGNDVDDTILGQPPTMTDVADDPDASADTVIGPGRSRPASSVDAAAVSPAPAVASPVLPPVLPAIPSIPASAHVNAAPVSTANRRTRIESPGASSGAAALAVSFPDGRTVALDRAVYVGRSPKSPRITSGLAPELVAVPSPRREVSSTHVEIQQQGGAVVVRDLGSTNGTRLSAPGAPPSLLSPGASRVVAAGTLLDLGDGIVLEIVERSGIVNRAVTNEGVAPSAGPSW